MTLIPVSPSHRFPSDRLRRVWFPAVVLATASALAVACDSSSSTTAAVPATPAAQSSPGADIYAASCARCHGSNLRGDGATTAIDSVRLSGLGDQRLRLVIASGKGEMPAFNGLSQAQVDALVSYMYEVAQ